MELDKLIILKNKIKEYLTKMKLKKIIYYIYNNENGYFLFVNCTKNLSISRAVGKKLREGYTVPFSRAGSSV